MAGKRTAMEAMELAREVEARLLAGGIAPHRLPPIEVTFAACWPLAKRLRRSRRQAEVLRGYADHMARQAEAAAGASAEGVDRLAAHWLQVLSREPARLVGFDPFGCHAGMRPAATPAQKEAA